MNEVLRITLTLCLVLLSLQININTSNINVALDQKDDLSNNKAVLEPRFVQTESNHKNKYEPKAIQDLEVIDNAVYLPTFHPQDHSCGNCFSEVTAALLTTYLKRTNAKYADTKELISPQQIMDCSTKYFTKNVGGLGCSGAAFDEVQLALENMLDKNSYFYFLSKYGMTTTKERKKYGSDAESSAIKAAKLAKEAEKASDHDVKAADKAFGAMEKAQLKKFMHDNRVNPKKCEEYAKKSKWFKKAIQFPNLKIEYGKYKTTQEMHEDLRKYKVIGVSTGIFGTAKKGIISDADCGGVGHAAPGGHAVYIFAFKKNDDGSAYWEARDSWAPNGSAEHNLKFLASDTDSGCAVRVQTLVATGKEEATYQVDPFSNVKIVKQAKKIETDKPSS